jgi:hypothetical protein
MHNANALRLSEGEVGLALQRTEGGNELSKEGDQITDQQDAAAHKRQTVPSEG